MKRTMIRGLMTILFTSLMLSGCTAPEYTPPDYSRYFWPPAPALKRVQLTQVIKTDLDIRPLTPSEEMFGKVVTFAFKKPVDIAVDTQGVMYVSDSYQGDVFVVNPNTKSITSFSTRGTFRTPYAVAIDNKNDLIAVGEANLIKLFRLSDRKALGVIGAKGKMFKAVVGIDFDPERKLLYVSDSKMHRVLRFKFDEWDTPEVITNFGTEMGGVYYPSQVEVAPDGNVYVVDTMHWRISIFDPEGKYIKSFGEHGDFPGMFGRPKGITINEDGFVFVSDGDFNVIQIFNKDGMAALVFGGQGSKPSSFTNPSGMDMANNKLYIVDQTNRRIQIFDIYSDSYYEEISEKSLDELSKDPNATNDEDEDENNIQ